MANTDDLRFVRTEAAMRAAFMELVSEQPVESITASAVCRRAEISRNAFYLHHSGVAALYSAMVDELLDDMRAACVASAERMAATGEPDEELTPSVIDVLARHEGLLRALLPSDDGSLAKRLAGGIANGYAEAASVLSEQGRSPEFLLRCAYLAWALLGILQRWIEITDESISCLLPYVSDFKESMQAGAMRLLMDDGINRS